MRKLASDIRAELRLVISAGIQTEIIVTEELAALIPKHFWLSLAADLPISLWGP